MSKYAVKLSYCGKNYWGWQEQKKGKTVQAVIEDSLAQIFGEKIKIYASGRTDSGVSVIGQVAHFSTDKNMPTGFVGYINSILPKDIRILAVKEVSDEFHARYSVKRKTYVYRMYMSDVEIPLYEEFALRVPDGIDVKKMNKEAQVLKGEHDFSAFCTSNTEVKTKTRTIYKICVKKVGDFIELSVTGNGFLYNMVRIITGTLIDIGLGKKEDLSSIMGKKDRKKAGRTAAAKGLVLKEVNYKGLNF